jgi:lipopolysaccharide/colanic/teichoic acid biosynthesis glycosyltransferase
MLSRIDELEEAESPVVFLPDKPWQKLVKRLMDVAGATVGLVVFLPVFVIAAALIKLTSRGPVLFKWRVVGAGGTPFTGYKFRYMVDGADRVRERLRHQNEMSGVFFKMKNDPRITSIGRVLRRYSLDELPQFWSVLRGQMSLVGPRPTQVFEYPQLADWQKQRVQVKHGLVSLWIVAGKTTDFEQMICLDLEYIEKWSIWLDLRILMLAVPYVVLGRNH